MDSLSHIGKGILLINIILFSVQHLSKKGVHSLFLVYLIFIFIIEVVSNVFYIKKINNLFLSHYYFIGQFLLLGIFFHQILIEKYQKKIAFLLLVTVSLVLIVQYSLDPKKYYTFNLFEIFITSYSIIILALFHLYNLLANKKEYYYITLGLLLYLISSTTIFLSGNLYTIMNKQMHKEIWIFNVLMFILYQIFILIEWLVNYRKTINK